MSLARVFIATIGLLLLCDSLQIGDVVAGDPSLQEKGPSLEETVQWINQEFSKMTGVYVGQKTGRVDIMQSDLLLSNGMLLMTRKEIGRSGRNIVTTYRANIANLDPNLFVTETEPPSLGNLYIRCTKHIGDCFIPTEGYVTNSLVLYLDANEEKLDKLLRAFKHLVTKAQSQQRPDLF